MGKNLIISIAAYNVAAYLHQVLDSLVDDLEVFFCEQRQYGADVGDCQAAIKAHDAW